MQPAGCTHPHTGDLKGGVFLLGIANIDYYTRFLILIVHVYIEQNANIHQLDLPYCRWM